MSSTTPIPSQQFPVYIIGAGGIVNTAHLPAYRLAGYDVQGITDIVLDKATATAEKFNIPAVYKSMTEMVQQAPGNAIFDVAVPGTSLLAVMEQLPRGAYVLLQKPMGENFREAKKIFQLACDKQLVAAVNFQLRYAPYMLAVKQLIQENQLGELYDIEINVNVYTPWHLWDFLFTTPRVEILYHSIHYIDLVRTLLGNPQTLFAKTTKHPAMPQLASVRSNIVMDYGENVRANILTNHCHNYGTAKQQSYIKIEGSKGAVMIQFGTLINYPEGIADRVEYILTDKNNTPAWQELKTAGSWFPHAFIGSMAQVMLAAEGTVQRPDNSVEDAIYTMACVEAAYCSGGKKAINPDSFFI